MSNVASLAVTCIVLLIVLPTKPDEVPEFQFPCYVDVCTFPRQFCNSDRNERRCSPCSRPICREERVPTACKYICMQYEKPVTTQPPATTRIPQSAESQSNGTDNLTSLYMIMAYSAITCTLIVVVLFVFIGYYVLHKRQKREKARPMLPEISYRSRINLEENEPFLEVVSQRLTEQRTCSRCKTDGLEYPNDIEPPSYRTNDGPSINNTPSSSSMSTPKDQVKSIVSPTSSKTANVSAATQCDTLTRQLDTYKTNATHDGVNEYHEKSRATGKLNLPVACTSRKDPDDSGDSQDDETSLKTQKT